MYFCGDYLHYHEKNLFETSDFRFSYYTDYRTAEFCGDNKNLRDVVFLMFLYQRLNLQNDNNSTNKNSFETSVHWIFNF